MTVTTDTLADPYSPATTAEGFDPIRYLAGFDQRLLLSSEGRRVLTRNNPLLFAIVYLPHHLKSRESGDAISFSEAHLEWYRMARTWIVPVTKPRSWRHAFIAPRAMGKSTVWYLVLPMWGAAHGHVRFAAAFASSAQQAEGHLATFRMELARNELLRKDYPELCAPYSGKGGSDTRHLIRQSNGFNFGARGIDAEVLGMKVGDARPDLLIADDLEPGEATYSDFQVTKRLSAFQNVVLPMNEYARVVMVGTVTMPGSITHALSKAAQGLGTASWITEEGFVPHHSLPILTNDDGTRRSNWPAKWPLSFLESIEHTRAYQLNYANNPRAREGVYWRQEDFTYGSLRAQTHAVLSVDPAVTDKGSSDRTGLAVVGYSASEKRCVVKYADGVQIQPGEPLRQKVISLLARFPEISAVLVETNQGGDTWRTILHDLPVPLRTVHQSVPKAVRASNVLGYYQLKRVVHEVSLPALEDQMIAFDGSGKGHDDIVDAAGSAILAFMPPASNRRPVSIQTV